MGLYRLFTAPPPHLMQSELQVWLPCVCVCVCVYVRARVCVHPDTASLEEAHKSLQRCLTCV